MLIQNGSRIKKGQGVINKIECIDFASICRQVVCEVIDNNPGDGVFMEASHDQKHITRSVRHGAQCCAGACSSRPLTGGLAGVMQNRIVFFAGLICLVCTSGCRVNDAALMPKPSWIQRAFVPRPSRLAEPEDRLKFDRVARFERQSGEAGLEKETAQLREGDLGAARLGKLKAGTDLFLKGKTYAAGYVLLKYGHLDLVLRDPNGGGDLVLFRRQNYAFLLSIDIAQKKAKGFSNFAFKGVIGIVSIIYIVLFGLSFWQINTLNKKLVGYDEIVQTHELRTIEKK